MVQNGYHINTYHKKTGNLELNESFHMRFRATALCSNACEGMIERGRREGMTLMENYLN